MPPVTTRREIDAVSRLRRLLCGLRRTTRPAVAGPRPIGVIPVAEARKSCVIAANAPAKRAGVTTGMAIVDARRRCPAIALVPQQPDLYTRVHHHLVAAVLDVLPIDAVCSIDELATSLTARDAPEATAYQIKQRLRDAVGERVTCSIGCAPNRWLAKIAADLEKPDGLTVLRPGDLLGRLLDFDLEALPGVARRMRARLARWGLASVMDLWQADPRRLRPAWGSVTGARLWYALHGYAVVAPSTRRRSFGHGRVLPPGGAYPPPGPWSGSLVVKAARRGPLAPSLLMGRVPPGVAVVGGHGPRGRER